MNETKLLSAIHVEGKVVMSTTDRQKSSIRLEIQSFLPEYLVFLATFKSTINETN